MAKKIMVMIALNLFLHATQVPGASHYKNYICVFVMIKCSYVADRCIDAKKTSFESI